MSIHVVKRDGTRVPLALEKIQNQIIRACDGIPNVSPSMIEIAAQIQFYDGMTTEMIDQLLLKAMVDLIDINERPDVGNTNYQYAAGRQRLAMLRKQVFKTYIPPSLYEIVVKNVERKVYSADLLQWYSKDEWTEMGSHIDHEKDERYSYAAIEQFVDKYLVRNRSTGELFETPQIRYMVAAATAFHMEKTERLQYVKDYYDAASDGLFTLATPVLAGLGTPTKQFSSCTLLRTDDNLDSIFATGEMMAKYAAKRAGIGLEIGRMRPLGSPIRNGEVSHTGIVPFLKKFYGDLRSCSQGGIRNACVSSDSFVEQLIGFEFEGNEYFRNTIININGKEESVNDILSTLSYLGDDNDREAYLQNLFNGN